MFSDIRDGVTHQVQTYPESFSPARDEDRFVDIRDAHTVAIVASHLGIPVEDLQPGPYELDAETTTQLNRGSLERYQESIRRLVGLL